MSASEEDGGDPACWSHLICVNCGRVLDDSDHATPSDEPVCRQCREENSGADGQS